jgi:hypothetical protein
VGKIEDGLKLVVEGILETLQAGKPVVETTKPAEKTAKPAEKATKTDAPKTDKKEEPSDHVAKTQELGELRGKCSRLVVKICEANNRPAAVALLEEFGAKNVPALKENQLAEFLEKATAILGA